MSTLIAPPSLNNTLGAVFIGNILAAILYGVTSLQTYIYYRCNQDGKILKGVIFVLWCLDGLHLALITDAVYVYVVTDFGNYTALETVEWGLAVTVLLCVISDFIIRSIFAYRIWRLSSFKFNWILILTMSSFSFVPIPACIVLVVGCVLDHSLIGVSRFSWAIYTLAAGGFTADIILASALCIMLSKQRTGFKRTDSVVHTLMLYGISTGALTTFFEGAVIVTYTVWRNDDVYLAFYLMVPKLLLNALLASLNARKNLRQRGNIVSIPLSPIPGTDRSIDSGGEVNII
ncbi:hypothetical protein EW026_g421 [Hermanssonia centrifuga]|uniref:DUF6534 domain-containing protein n=1 Tax=Hermanssonia centrifuga TaxID=98765 RepID=A0A4S4KWE7_9APHY|nr:hypothetical protein EW026_g421 [Hermanssonia centrifuga]